MDVLSRVADAGVLEVLEGQSGIVKVFYCLRETLVHRHGCVAAVTCSKFSNGLSYVGIRKPNRECRIAYPKCFDDGEKFRAFSDDQTQSFVKFNNWITSFAKLRIKNFGLMLLRLMPHLVG